MKRRSFLGTLASLAAVSTIPLSAHDLPEDVHLSQDFLLVDDFTSHGWRIRWMGWRTLPNQIITFGLWFAIREYRMNTTDLSLLDIQRLSGDDFGWVSTTLGHCGQYSAFEVFDCTYYKEHGTKLNPFSSEAEKLAAKRLALKNLLMSLKTGQSFPERGL